MKKIIVCFVALLLAIGCKEEIKPKWVKITEAKVIKIEIVGVGGWGSPNAVRVWRLDNGMTVSMYDWKNEDICVGDIVVKYRRVPSKWNKTMWRKKIKP